MTRIARVDDAGLFLLDGLSAALEQSLTELVLCGRPAPAVAAALPAQAVQLPSLDLAL